MYKSAIKIKEQLLNETKPILRKACKENNVRSNTLYSGNALMIAIAVCTYNWNIYMFRVIDW